MKYAAAKDYLSLINESDNEGETPLHDAARNGNLQNMKVIFSFITKIQKVMFSNRKIIPFVPLVLY